MRLFTDDCALHRDIKTTEDARKLQDDLEQLHKRERDWPMEFHPKKCQVTNITSKRNIISHKYNIHGHTLEVVDSAKYLGLNIHKSLKWNDHTCTCINQVTKKANSTLAFLRCNLHHCPRPTKSLCYLTLIRPLTEYSAVIWNPHTVENIRKLEMIQRRAAQLPNNQQCFNYAKSTPMDNPTRMQGPSESIYDVPCCEPADRYSISDPGIYHLAQR
jgi:hypothetical protein